MKTTKKLSELRQLQKACASYLVSKKEALNENESVSVEVVSDYQLSAKDLFLNENEYAIELALKKYLKDLFLKIHRCRGLN